MGSKRSFVLMAVFVVFFIGCASFVYSINPRDDCQLCRRYADANRRSSASWSCVNFDDTPLLTDFVGYVNWDDDFDLKVSCIDPLLQTNCQLCRRYADANRRDFASWSCVNFDDTPLLTDFVGYVNWDDDFDLKVNCECECSSGECCDGCYFRPNTYECRSAVGECDVAEYCSGAAGGGCPSGIVGYWKFDENPQIHMDTAGDDSGRGNIGTFYTNDGATNKAVAGKLNFALSFDGVDDYVEVANNANLNPTKGITIESWINPSSTNNNIAAIVKKSDASQTNGYTLESNSIVTGKTNTFRFVVYTGDTTNCPRNDALGNPAGWCSTGSTPPLEAGKWHHLVGTYDGSNIKLYLNGNLISTVGVSGNIGISSNSLMIGKDPSNPTAPNRFFKGNIDEVAIYGRALTAEEVSKLYQNSLAKYGYCEQPTTPRGECPEDVFKPFGEKCSIGVCDFFGNCLDCDTNEEICKSRGCGGVYFFGGEENTCCGDEGNEYYNNRKGEVMDINDVACCGYDIDCVYGGVCYRGGERHTLDGETHDCNNGVWGIGLKQKCDWDNKCGYCGSDSQCYADQDGCVDDGVFVEDHLCENGEWTSRTKLIALQLLDIADKTSPGDYTLFCDTYENTLNYYQYLVGGVPATQHLSEVNNFCVLRLPEQVIFGASLNIPIDEGGFISAITGVNNCDDAIDCDNCGDEQFHKCGGSLKAWYNNRTQSLIYSNKDIEHMQAITAWDKFLLFLKNPFNKIFDFLFGLFKEEGFNPRDYEFMRYTKDFSRIYLDRENIRSIKGITEKVRKPIGGEYLSVTYGMYSEDVCSTVNKAFERLRPLQRDLALCYYDARERAYYVVSNSSAALALWPDLTSKLRTRAPPVVPMQYCYARKSCGGGENAILGLSGVEDAHASKLGVGGFGYELCCPDDYELDSSCSEEEIVELSSEDDAHANAPNIDLFEEQVCIKAEDASRVASCESVLYPGGCYPDEICVVSLSDIGDAHVSSCEDTYFKVRVCCKIT